MKTRLAMFVAIVLALSTAAAAQAPPANRAPTSGTLRQIIPGHYVYTQNNAGRLFNSGVIAAGDGVLVFDALDSEALRLQFAERGCWIRPFGDIVYLTPPFVMEANDLSSLTSAVHDVLRAN